MHSRYMTRGRPPDISPVERPPKVNRVAAYCSVRVLSRYAVSVRRLTSAVPVLITQRIVMAVSAASVTLDWSTVSSPAVEPWFTSWSSTVPPL